MTSTLEARTSQPDIAKRDMATAHSSKYHPRCGQEHSHKPTKAIIGVGLLILLSFLLHEINGRASAPQSGAPPHSIAYNAR